MDADSHAAASALLLLPFLHRDGEHTIFTQHQKATMASSRAAADSTTTDFAFKEIGTERFLYQVKSTCAAMEHCVCKNTNRVPKQHRCICCGFACHYSCSLKIQPYRDDFPGTEVCLECVESYDFPTIKHRRTLRVASDHAKLVKDVHEGLYLVPLELLSPDEFNEKVFEQDEDSTISNGSNYSSSAEEESDSNKESDGNEEDNDNEEKEEVDEEEEEEEQEGGDEEQEQLQDEEEEEIQQEDDDVAPPADDEEEQVDDEDEEQVPSQAPRSIHALLNSNQRLKVERLATSLHSKHSNDFFCRRSWPKLDGFYVHINEVKANKSGTETKNVAAKKRDVTQISVLATSNSSLQRFKAAFRPKDDEFDYHETTSVDEFCKRLKK